MIWLQDWGYAYVQFEFLDQTLPVYVNIFLYKLLASSSWTTLQQKVYFL